MKRVVSIALLFFVFALGAAGCKDASLSNKPAADKTPPEISDVLASAVTESKATISWITDEEATGQVEFGLTAGYGSTSPLNDIMITSHSITISGLASGTAYHYRVKSKDASGNNAVSADYTFTTLADTALPEISSTASTGITQSSATITWTTSEPSTSDLVFGLTTGYGSNAPAASDTTADKTSHSITINGLSAGTTYHYQVKSKDIFGNEAVSADYTFTTLAALSSVPDVTGTINTSFVWQFASEQFSWDIPVSKALYEYYHERTRASTENYSVYVTDPLDDVLIKDIVSRLKAAAQERSYNDSQTVNFAVTFVQSLPYTSDAVTTAYDEYPRYPVETLVDNGGDCEDTSVLMASILDEMGYSAVLVRLPNHMAVGVLGGTGISGVYYEHNGGKYYYLETTGSGWKIGELPPEYQSASATLYDIVPTPILSHTWSAEWESKYMNDKIVSSSLKVQVIVTNNGTAAATGVYVYAALDAGGGLVWNKDQSAPFDMQPGAVAATTLTMEVSGEINTRLIVKIVDDGYVVDDNYSDWFDLK